MDLQEVVSYLFFLFDLLFFIVLFLFNNSLQSISVVIYDIIILMGSEMGSDF